MPVLDFPASWEVSPHLRDAPVQTREDVLRLMPRWMREGEPTAVVEGIADGVLEAFVRRASKLAEYGAQANAIYATGDSLDLCGEAVGIRRALAEDDEAYRTRVLAQDAGITPRAILEQIDDILAPVTVSQAYYYERPDDEPFVRSKTHDSTGTGDLGIAGVYVSGKASDHSQPIRKANRHWTSRTRCQPKHVFLFDHRRGWPAPTDTSGTLPAVVATYFGGVITYRETATSDDATAPDNGHGHTVIGLPAWLEPGERKPGDAFVSVKATAPLTDAGGVLTAAATQKGGVLASVFAKATVVTRAGSNLPSGPAVYPSAWAADLIVSAIRSMISVQGMFGAQFSLLFDPKVA